MDRPLRSAKPQMPLQPASQVCDGRQVGGCRLSDLDIRPIARGGLGRAHGINAELAETQAEHRPRAGTTRVQLTARVDGG